MCLVEVPEVLGSTPSEVVSSSGSAPVRGLEDCKVRRVDERAETLVGLPVVSSLSEELDAELMAQSESCSAGMAQSRRDCLRRPTVQLEGVLEPCGVVGERSRVISGVEGWRYSCLRSQTPYN